MTLVVAAASALAVNPGSLIFSGATGGASPPAQTLSLSGPTSGLSYAATASSTGNWLAVGALRGTAPGGLLVSVNPAGLAAGQYAGSITLTPVTGAPQVVLVTLILSAGQTFTVVPLSLTFSAPSGATSNLTQLLTVASSSPSEPFTVSAGTQDSQGWLSVSPAALLTSGTVTVTVNPTQLTTGTHVGFVTVTGGGVSQNITVTVSVATTA